MSWNVPCFVCGFELGTNKEKCGQAGAGGKKHPRPPCVWAESDNTVVLSCQKKDKARRSAELEAQRLYQQQQEQYKSGNLLTKDHTFTEGRSSSDEEVFEQSPKRKWARTKENTNAAKNKKVTATEHDGGRAQATSGPLPYYNNSRPHSLLFPQICKGPGRTHVITDDRDSASLLTGTLEALHCADAGTTNDLKL